MSPRFHSQQNTGGSMLLEFILAMPLLLLLMLGCMQIAHIWVARLVTYYAATAAARALLTAHESEYQWAAAKAAMGVLSWVVIGEAKEDETLRSSVPGWGTIPGTGSVRHKTRVTITPLNSGVPWNFRVDVEFDFALVMPIAGPIIAWGVNPWEYGKEWQEQHADVTSNRYRNVDIVGYPHIILHETAIISKPYQTRYPVYDLQ